MKELDTFRPDELGPRGAYHFLNSVIAPRPIAWVSTIAPDGTPNLAPHSYTTVVSDDPPIVAFVSIGRKDTLRNVEATGEFVYNIGNQSLVERINRTAADFPPGENEFEWAGVTPLPSELVRPPRVAEAPVQMEAVVTDVYEVRAGKNYIVMGEVKLIHLDPSVRADNGRVDARKLQPVCRLAGSEYASFGDVYSLERPTYAGLLEQGATPMEPIEGE